MFFWYNNITFNIRHISFNKKSINITSLVIPKIYINGNNLSVTCYLSKKDIKKLKKRILK